MARIAVLMGVYNCAPYIKAAIDSIICQTYSDWKLIICDDGSTDNTLIIVEEFKKKYPNKIHIIKNRMNKGLNYTLNHCLRYADSEYIARMDGDDISLPKRFEKELAFLDEHPEYSIVSCPMFYFDENGKWGCGKAKKIVTKEDFLHGTPFCHAPSMFRRDAIDTIGGYSNDPRTYRAEDYDLWFRMYAKGFKGYNLSEPLYMMRDDHNAFKRRKLKYSLNEVYVRWNGYKLLDLPKYKRIYALRPLIVRMIPPKIYMYLHHKIRNVNLYKKGLDLKHRQPEQEDKD